MTLAEEKQQRYVPGECYLLAQAIGSKTGWRVVQVIECGESPEGIGVPEHGRDWLCPVNGGLVPMYGAKWHVPEHG
jgi:hypothetical protein